MKDLTTLSLQKKSQCRYINRKEQRMSDRLLKESDVLKAIDKRIEELSKDPVFIRKNGIIDIMGVKKYILAIPSVERPQGEWILECDAEGEGDNLYRCSECGQGYGCQEYDLPNYCPNCGARMNGADDE